MTPTRLTAGLLPLLAVAAAVAVVAAGCGTAQPAAGQGPGTAMAARPARTVVPAGQREHRLGRARRAKRSRAAGRPG